jgi:hypothetical protein
LGGHGAGARSSPTATSTSFPMAEDPRSHTFSDDRYQQPIDFEVLNPKGALAK